MPTPVQTMFAATSSATRGSRRCQPVSATAPTPRRTPTEVQTSVSRCCALASRVMELRLRPTCRSNKATPRFTNEARTETTKPRPICSSGLGVMRRTAAAYAMLTAATRISVPSTPLEKYSALPWPYGWSSSAGRAATVNIAKAIIPPTKLTPDSMASESRPTEPVRR